MNVRVAAGLFRLWVVFSVLWLAAFGTYTVVSYQNAPQHNLINARPMFDDLIPAYEDCWSIWSNGDSSDGKKLDGEDWVRIEDLPQVAECERVVDRWQIVRNGLLIALGIPIAIFVVGWGFVWAFRGFLPARSP